jgi:hypothetical protein
MTLASFAFRMDFEEQPDMSFVNLLQGDARMYNLFLGESQQVPMYNLFLGESQQVPISSNVQLIFG